MLPDHFFRQESGRLVAALTRAFGLHNLALAEDVTQDVLCRALESWKFHGLPDDPHAWLITAARNRALDVLRRERTRREFSPELGFLLESEWTLTPAVDEVFAPQALEDNQLRVLFSLCHPDISEDAQVAVMLQVLGGFGTGEVAAAFLVREAAMEKRLQRAKEKLAQAKLFDLARDDVSARLGAVQRALYLLFNEGYHGAHPQQAIREELCAEAMRCVDLLLGAPATGGSSTQALSALMSFLAARLGSRTDGEGELLRLEDQDRSAWNQKGIDQGTQLLGRALASGGWTSNYHFEAAIAGAHTTAERYEDTPWEAIVKLYDGLLALDPSPVVGLNRAVAFACWQGPERGLEALHALPGRDALETYPFYAATLGELELRRGRREVAAKHFARAVELARNPSERRYLSRRKGLSRAQVIHEP